MNMSIQTNGEQNAYELASYTKQNIDKLFYNIDTEKYDKALLKVNVKIIKKFY